MMSIQCCSRLHYHPLRHIIILIKTSAHAIVATFIRYPENHKSPTLFLYKEQVAPIADSESCLNLLFNILIYDRSMLLLF